jgi:hypothetical protein
MKRRVIALLMIMTMILSASAFTLGQTNGLTGLEKTTKAAKGREVEVVEEVVEVVETVEVGDGVDVITLGETNGICKKTTPLMAVKGKEQVGNVYTWDNGETLFIHYVLDECTGWKLESTHVHIEKYDCECQAMKPNNYTEMHCDETEYLYEIPFECEWCCDDELMIAAHAMLVKEVCETVVEAGELSVFSSGDGSTVILGDSDPYPAVLSYDDEQCSALPDLWDSQLVLGIDPFAFNPLSEWIWNNPVVLNPVVGEEVTFITEFEAPGEPTSAMLYAACDNGMAIYLNDVLLRAVNLPEYPDLGDYGDTYVTQGWENVQEVNMMVPIHQGTNVLKIIGVNEQMNEGDECTNPAGLKFEFHIEWEGIEECCCIRSAAWAYENRCPKPSWATYYPYILCGCYIGEAEPMLP